MSNCPKCSTPMKVLFVGWYCPNNCDKPTQGNTEHHTGRYYTRWGHGGVSQRNKLLIAGEPYPKMLMRSKQLDIQQLDWPIMLECWGPGIQLEMVEEDKGHGMLCSVLSVDRSKGVFMRALDWNKNTGRYEEVDL